MAADIEAPRERPSLARATAVMTAGTVISRATGVVRIAVFAAVLGVTESRLPDAYNLANMAPNVLYELVLGGVISAVFVPLFVELLENEPRERADEVMEAVLTFSVIALAGLALVGVLAAPLIAGFYSSRLDGADAALQRDVITFLLRLFIPQIALYALYFVGSAILNAKRRFGPQMFTPIVNNLVLIAVLLYFGAAYGAVSLEEVTREQLLVIGLGTTASVAPMGILLVPYLRAAGIRRPRLRAAHPALRRLGRLAAPVVGMVAVNQVGYVVIQWLSNKQTGGYTSWIAASTFFLLPIGLFVWSITTALMPALSESATRNDTETFRDQLSTGIRSLLFLMIPSAVGYVLLAKPLVEVMLEHGIVTGRSTDLVARVLVFMVLGLVQFSLFQMLTRASYALQDTKTPFLVNVGVIATIVAIGVPAFGRYGVPGLAAGQGIAYTAGVVVLGRYVSRRAGGLGLGRALATGLRAAAAAAAMSVVVLAVAAASRAVAAGDARALITVIAATIAGGATYLGAAVALKMEEVGFLRQLVRRRAR